MRGRASSICWQVAVKPTPFPWAIDREAFIWRRIVPKPRSDEALEAVIDLTPLHLAVSAYLSERENTTRIEDVRHHLAVVLAATAGDTLPFAWREMHEFTTILLDAP